MFMCVYVYTFAFNLHKNISIKITVDLIQVFELIH